MDDLPAESCSEPLKAKAAAGEYAYSKHAVDQSILRRISEEEVAQAISTSREIIEDYPDDKYGPSGLVMGFTHRGRPLHIQISHPSRKILRVVTVYEPDVNLWINFKIRKPEEEG